MWNSGGMMLTTENRHTTNSEQNLSHYVQHKSEMDHLRVEIGPSPPETGLNFRLNTITYKPQ
jgi:hypothetical protein